MELETLVRDFESFLNVTEQARQLSERDRDYVDHKQWTAEEVAQLKARGQAPIVINKLKRKVSLLTGLQRETRTMPKALPRTPKHEAEADSCTAALRYVCDNVEFTTISSDVFEDTIIWGYGAAITEVQQNGEEIEVVVKRIDADRFYFDPHSRRKDFSDAAFMGIVIWMDEDDAEAMFPDMAEEIEGIMSTHNVGGTTFDDRPLWVDRARKRLRVCQHYFKDDGVWHVAYFTDNLFLREPEPSGYLDEHGNPDCPIEAVTAYIDLENDRYGEVRGDVWLQDEINHRRSKLLYLMSVRQTMGEEGAVPDVNEMKAELARPDGHVRINPGRRFDIIPTNDFAQGQMWLYQQSDSEIDVGGANAALGGTQEAALSGRAIQAIQQGGVSQISPLIDRHKRWEKRMYRQMWNRIRQFWQGPKWVRVTDDQNSMEWVGLNQPQTLAQALQQEAENGNPQAGQMLQQLMAAQDPRLNEPVAVQNQLAELDVDIIVSDSPNHATIRQEQFQMMTQLATAYGPQAVPFEVILELSDLPNKEAIKSMLQPDVDPEQAQAQAQIQARAMQEAFREQVLKNEELEAKIRKLNSEVAENVIDATQKEMETEKLALAPVDAVSISV